MIDFASAVKAHRSKYLGAESLQMEKQLKESAQKITQCLKEGKNGKFRLGGYLLELYRSQNFAVMGCKYDPIGNIGNCSPTVFFSYLADTFDLDKSQVSRVMNVADEFGVSVPNGHGGEATVCQTKYHKRHRRQTRAPIQRKPRDRPPYQPIRQVRGGAANKRSAQTTE